MTEEAKMALLIFIVGFIAIGIGLINKYINK